jgi:NRPS condensation-like uncharacterized protein
MNRLLGASEHFLWLRDRAWSVNFAMTACIQGTLSEQQLSEALAWLQRRHPMLGVKIAIADCHQPRFVSENVPAIPLRVVKQAETHWSQEVAEEIVKPFPWQEGPLLRVVFLPRAEECELIFICHHAIADALSVVYLIRDLLQELSKPGGDRQILPILPPLEELIPPSACFNNDASAEITKHIASDETETVTPRQWRPSILHWSLSTEETARLIKRCREEQASVHGALCASFLLSLVAQEEGILKCLSPLNVRRYLVPPVEEDMGVFMTLLVTAHQLKANSDFWKLAREVKHQINQVVAAGKIFQDLPKIKAFVSARPHPNAVYEQVLKRGDDLAVSNLGRLDIPLQYGKLHLKALYGPTLLGSEQVKVASATTLGGQIFFTLAVLKSIASPVVEEKIKTTAMQHLRSAMGRDAIYRVSTGIQRFN